MFFVKACPTLAKNDIFNEKNVIEKNDFCSLAYFMAKGNQFGIRKPEKRREEMSED